MSDEGDLHRRVSKLESQHDKLSDSIHELVISTKLLAENVSQMSEIIKELKSLEPRIRVIELDAQNSKLISKALIWVAGSVASTAIIMAINYLSNLA